MSTVTITEIEAFGFHLPLEILLVQGFTLIVAAIVIVVVMACKEGGRQVDASLARALPPRTAPAGGDALPPLPQRVPGATLAAFFRAPEDDGCQQHEWIPARTLDGDERDMCLHCGDRRQPVTHAELGPMTEDEARWLDLEFHEEAGQ